MSILDKIAENVDYSQNVNLGQYLQISWFWSKFSKNFDFSQYLCKSRSWSKFMKISILVKNVEKFSIFVNIYGNLDFG